MSNNQTKSNGRGGPRKGAGRPPGSANRKTREIADRAVQEGVTPLEFLLGVMRAEVNEPRDRMAAAIAAAPYIHPKLASVEMTGKDEGPIEMVFRWQSEKS